MEAQKQHIQGSCLGLFEVDIRGGVGMKFPISVVKGPFCSFSEAPPSNLGGTGTPFSPDLHQDPSKDPKIHNGGPAWCCSELTVGSGGTWAPSSEVAGFLGPSLIFAPEDLSR